MPVSVHDTIAAIDAAEWDALAGEDYPFLKHAFLATGERTGCVSAEAGWTPCHLALRDSRGRLRGALPLYEKTHSWGEFVFDWAWANAYERAGLRYYPKLVSAVPYTPAASSRLLLADRNDAEGATALIEAALARARERGCSSVHVLFPHSEELVYFERAGLKIRKDCQFHWHNDGYSDFDEFISTFSAAKRKKARRDRRRVAEAGITFRHLHGSDVSVENWQIIYQFISKTFMQRGSMPYYDLDFFERIAAALPDQLLVVMGEIRGTPVSAAIFYVGSNALYGRYWGSSGYYNALHFETCYYQGIDYCIQHGIQTFEPGTQGEHKISRGFVPHTTWSAHWLAHPEFYAAVEAYVDDEAEYIDRYMRAVDRHSPYRRRRDSA